MLINNCSNCIFFESFRAAYLNDMMEPDDQGFCNNSNSPVYGNEGANSDYVCDYHSKINSSLKV